GNADSDQDREGGVAEEHTSQMADTAHPDVGQPDWQQHLQKARKVIGANVGARSPIAVHGRLDEVPDVIRAGGKLIDSIHGYGHAQENQDADQQLGEVLPDQVVQNDKKQERINKDSDQFLARHVLDVRLVIADNRVNDKGCHCP